MEGHVIQKKHSDAPKMWCHSSSPHLALPWKYFMSLCFLLLLLRNIIASLAEFPPVGKPLLQVWWGACKSIWVEGASSGSRIQGTVKSVLTGEHSGLARAACDFALPKITTVTVLKKDLQVGIFILIAHVHASGVPVQCWVSFFKPAFLRGVN